MQKSFMAYPGKMCSVRKLVRVICRTPSCWRMTSAFPGKGSARNFGTQKGKHQP